MPKLRKRKAEAEQPRSHDRTREYHPTQLPRHAQIAAVEIEDPYAEAGRIREGELDVAVGRRHGLEGIAIVRDVLGESLAIDTAASRRGAARDREVRWWGGLFRRCLNVLAARLGYASS